MDLAQNWNPRFTEWLVENGHLGSPFALIDAGAQGGIHPRWTGALGPLVHAHGFDPLEEAIEALGASQSPRRQYHCLALGADDGEREIFLAKETTASSFYSSNDGRYAIRGATERTSDSRLVPVRSLDSLLNEGVISRADLIKIDCEGAEPEILQGAQKLLARGVIAVEVETNFNVSPFAPRSHFVAVSDYLIPSGFVLADLAFDRIRRRSFAERARALGIRYPATIARPATVNALFYRDGPPASAEEPIKRIVILELYGLCDSAFAELTTHFAMLPPGPDWQYGADLLVSWPSFRGLARRARASLLYRWGRILARR